MLNFGNDWLSGEVNKINIPKRIFYGGALGREKIYRELINVQLYSPKLAVMEDPLRAVLVLMEVCTREIQNTSSVTWGALQIPCCWAYL